MKITEKGESWFEQYLCITMVFINIAALTLLFYTHIQIMKKEVEKKEWINKKIAVLIPCYNPSFALG